jgi:hypothetical protein
MGFDTKDPIGSLFADLHEKPAWLVRKGYAGSLLFEFGAPHVEFREISARSALPANVTSLSPRLKSRGPRRHAKISGDWHLWIDCCDWGVFEGEALVAHSESSAAEIEAAAAFLNGQRLIKATAGPEKGASTFVFDLGGRLNTSPYDDWEEDETCWSLFTPSGSVFSYRGDGCYSWRPDDTPRDKLVWLQLPVV